MPRRAVVLTHHHEDGRSGRDAVPERGRTRDRTTAPSPGAQAGLHPLTVLRLQQSAGNTAVARLVAARPTAAPPKRRTGAGPAEQGERPDASSLTP